MESSAIKQAVDDVIDEFSSEAVQTEIQEHIEEIGVGPGYAAAVTACFATQNTIDTCFSDLPDKAQTLVVSVQLAYSGAWKLRDVVTTSPWNDDTDTSREQGNIDLLVGKLLIAKAISKAAMWGVADKLLSFREDTYQWLQGTHDDIDAYYADIEEEIINVISDVTATIPNTRDVEEIKKFAYGIGDIVESHGQFPTASMIQQEIEQQRQSHIDQWNINPEKSATHE